MSIRTGKGYNDERSDSGFDDSLCDIPEAVLVGLVVAFVNGKVKSVGTVDLDVYQARAVNGRSALGPAITSWLGREPQPEDIATKVHNLQRPFFPLVKCPLREITGLAPYLRERESVTETNLSIENDTSLLINPKILIHQLAIFLG